MQYLIKLIDTNLSRLEAKLSGDGGSFGDLSSLQTCYNNCIRLCGETDLRTIQLGLDLVRELFMANHTIEAQRLLNKLAVSSRRVHGRHPDGG